MTILLIFSLEVKAKTLVGDVTLTTQAKVITFGANNYTNVTGNVSITVGDISDLSPLSTLDTVGGYLYNGVNHK